MNYARLSATTEASVWAEEFCNDFGGGKIDMALMIGWFSNAIEIGRDAGFREGMAHASSMLAHPGDGF